MSLRKIVRVTLVFSGPLIFFTASWMVMPFVIWPSIFRIRSPALSPALNAGVSSMGETTVSWSFCMAITIPSPPKVPLVSTCSSLYCSGVMKALWGSSDLIIPADGLVDELFLLHILDVVLLDDVEDFVEELEALVRG